MKMQKNYGFKLLESGNKMKSYEFLKRFPAYCRVSKTQYYNSLIIILHFDMHGSVHGALSERSFF